MARKLPKIKKLRKKSGKKEGKLDGREDKMLEDLMKLSAKYGLYTCNLPFEIPEELRVKATNGGYLVKDGCVSWAVPADDAESVDEVDAPVVEEEGEVLEDTSRGVSKCVGGEVCTKEDCEEACAKKCEEACAKKCEEACAKKCEEACAKKCEEKKCCEGKCDPCECGDDCKC